jgi:hypothetical protein
MAGHLSGLPGNRGSHRSWACDPATQLPTKLCVTETGHRLALLLRPLKQDTAKWVFRYISPGREGFPCPQSCQRSGCWLWPLSRTHWLPGKTLRINWVNSNWSSKTLKGSCWPSHMTQLSRVAAFHPRARMVLIKTWAQTLGQISVTLALDVLVHQPEG